MLNPKTYQCELDRIYSEGKFFYIKIKINSNFFIQWKLKINKGYEQIGESNS